VDLYAVGGDDLRVRYVHDEAQGEIVKVLIPGKDGDALQFDRNQHCSVLEGDVEKTNVSSWSSKGNIRHVNGHLMFDCKNTAGKGRVTGEVTFTGCH
jgi:hypothetical protein